MQLKKQIYKKKKSKTSLVYLMIWFISIVIAVIWTYENPDKIELIKNIYTKNQDPVSKEIKAQSIKNFSQFIYSKLRKYNFTFSQNIFRFV